MKLTELEVEVLRRLKLGLDPWYGGSGGVGSRTVSQALGRLRKKGAIEGMVLTDAGRDALTAATP